MGLPDPLESGQSPKNRAACNNRRLRGTPGKVSVALFKLHISDLKILNALQNANT